MTKPTKDFVGIRLAAIAKLIGVVFLGLSLSSGPAFAAAPKPQPVGWWLSNVANDGPGPRGAVSTPGGNCERCLKASGVKATPAWSGALTRIANSDFDSTKGCQFNTLDGKTQDNGCIVGRTFVCAAGYYLSGNACVAGRKNKARKNDVRTLAKVT
jgi:hypothetical protein